MNGHVKSMNFQQFMGTAATLLSLLLLMAVASTRTVAASRSQLCANDMQQNLKLSRLTHKEAATLSKTYITSQGEMFESFCKVAVTGIPDPNISGMEPSERIVSIYSHLQAFFPHFNRVLEQQTDLQPPESPLLAQIKRVTARSKSLASRIKNLYQILFPNLPAPEPAGGPTTLPPSQNIFQQKVYGCVLLKTYKELVANVSKELRTLKNKVCRRGARMNTLF
ncbi:IL-6 subfamily cytokine M17 [Mugil cephalus]|uniref:IL-6 subfamily cytokine M17 n=1 Tax=Mugil cephalus TaxID=48193 RepID=UPI001FB80F62|nr:IL-6 subfamily cytokine M17 [Mugil cephalus]